MHLSFSSCFLGLILFSAVACCMLLCLRRRRGASSIARFPTTTRASLSTVSSSAATPRLQTRTMFQNAIKKHNASTSAQRSSAHFFSSSPLPAEKAQPLPSEQTQQAARPGPLSNGSANVIRLRPPIDAKGAQNGQTGFKRTSTGLTKALSGGQTFDDSFSNSAANPIVIDENDFDSDIDLDVEDPASKGVVAYPALPPVPSSFLAPTAPRKAPHTDSISSTVGSGYVSQLLHDGPKKKFESPAPSPTQALPWSSSPPENPTKPPQSVSLDSYAYQPSTRCPVKKDLAPSPSKPPPKKRRRNLPWANEELENAREREEDSGARGKIKAANGRLKAAQTPAPNRNSTLPWTTTASAVKEQQKKLREAKRKPTAESAKDVADASAHPSKRNNARISRVFLSDEQRNVLNLVTEKGKSVFFTGSAGTGKSVLLREIIAALRRKYIREPDRVAVTASTGLAACNVGGVTLHSFAGIGLGKEAVPELTKKIKRNQKAKHRWMRTKILVIDEISMVDGDLFDKLEELARHLRGNGRPFGGIQLVITGDFFQLPPVPDYGKVAKFAFDAHSWNTTVEHTIGLHHVFRQKDPEFAKMLNEMREGKLMPASIDKFRKMNRELSFQDDMEATELFPTRAEVDNANSNRMNRLHGEVRTFEARDGGTMTDLAARTKLLANCMAPERIDLKKGAQVMLIKNIDEQLVNGSLGKVVAFMTEQTFARYTENEDKFKNGSGQVDEASQATRSSIQESLGVAGQLYPLVQFTLPDGTSRELLCQRESWKVELPNGEVQASRSQVPLILAWAISIHKAQGQTLERVKVNLGRVFEKGQAYVALSRATSVQGLQVMNFDPKKVVAHDRVRSFYASLSRAEEHGQKKVAGITRGQKLEDVEFDDYEDGYGDYLD